MEKSEMMKKFEVETGKQSAIVKFMAGGQALEQKSYPKLGPYDYSMDYIAWLESKAEAYDELKCTPNLPDEYNVFLVYLVRNRGDFHKTIRVLTDEGRCSLECMKWFAVMLGISWDPDWR